MDFRTAEQKAEFDSLFKSFMETFNKQFNQIRSIQIKINEQVKSIEVKNDKFFHEACARLSEPESPDRSSNSTPTSQTDIDKEKLSSAGDESEISQSTGDGTKQSFEHGKSFLSPIPSPGVQYEAVSEDEFATGEPIKFTSEYPLFDCKAFSTGNAQTGSDVFGVSETHCTSVRGQLPIDQRLISQSPTSVDSNMPRSDSNLFQPVDYSPDEAPIENVNPCLSDECSVLSSDANNEAILHTLVRHPSESDQTESDTSACLSDDVCSLTRDTSPPFLVSDPLLKDKRTHSAGSFQPSIPRHGPDLGSGTLIDTLTQEPLPFLFTGSRCDETMHNASVLPPTIPRHGPDLQNDYFVSIDPDSEGFKAQNLTPFSSLGKGDVGSLPQKAFLVTSPSLVPPRYCQDQEPNTSLGIGQCSKAKVAHLALSFPRHGPDEQINCFVGVDQDSVSFLSSVFDLYVPKDGPNILAFFRQLPSTSLYVNTQVLLASQSARRTSAIRMAEGRETYGRLRPVRRPWFF